MITDVPGVLVGHWTDSEAMTGCTVIVLPPDTVASGEIRGGAPASREFALLDPIRTVGHVDAVVLSGGSAFGLAAGDGVIDGLAAQDRGFETAAGRVPIVVGLSLFDLAVGDGSVRPGPTEGRLALDAAATGHYETGLVGAGTGATCNKWSGSPEPGGVGTATIFAASASASTDSASSSDAAADDSGSENGAGDAAPLIVSALIVVNAVGAIDDGTSAEDIGPPVRPDQGHTEVAEGTNTTIGLVVTNAKIDKLGCHWLAQSAHDGLARCLLPAHTAADGDGIIAAVTGQVEADQMHLRLLAQAAVTKAVRSLAKTV